LAKDLRGRVPSFQACRALDSLKQGSLSRSTQQRKLAEEEKSS